MDLLPIGIVTNPTGLASPLASVVRHHPEIDVIDLGLDDPPSPTVAGLVVDLPVSERAAALACLGQRWQVPILVESPIALDRAQAAASLGQDGRPPIIALNPLRSWLPLRRLAEEVARDGDPVETIFAAWRFRPEQAWDHALPQLVDYVSFLTGSRPMRIAAMARPRPNLLLVTLRFENDVVASLELGQHLPPASPVSSTFLLECFCRDRVYHATPEQQAVSIVGATPAERDWSPGPAPAMVDAFVHLLRHPANDTDTSAAELDLLRLRDEILTAAAQREVRGGILAEAR